MRYLVDSKRQYRKVLSPHSGIPMSDLTGEVFGMLTVAGFMGFDKRRNTKWLCLCRCGEQRVVVDYALKSGLTFSCGCSRRMPGGTPLSAVGLTHGLSTHPLYRLWVSMRRRCNLKTATGYSNYGGRGIAVCDEWDSEFMPFYMWAIGNSWEKGLQLDREDNNKGYSPSNCRFVSVKENCNNKRLTVVKSTGYSCVHPYANKNFPYKVMYKRKCHGYYSTPIKAAIAKDMLVIKDKGMKATMNYQLNVPEIIWWSAI